MTSQSLSCSFQQQRHEHELYTTRTCTPAGVRYSVIMVGNLQHEARKALSSGGLLSGVRKGTLDLEGVLTSKS